MNLHSAERRETQIVNSSYSGALGTTAAHVQFALAAALSFASRGWKQKRARRPSALALATPRAIIHQLTCRR